MTQDLDRPAPSPPIVLVRHGEAACTVEGVLGGWSDSPLTELGREQVTCLARRLKEELADVPCRMLASDVARAWQTAEILARELDLEALPAPGLRAYNNGAAVGCSRDEGEALRLPVTQPLVDWQMFPEAETWRQFHRRNAVCLDEITRDQAETLLLVTHSGVVLNATFWWLQLDEELLGRVGYASAPASITVLDTSPWAERRVARSNDTAHLYAAGLGGGLRLRRHPEPRRSQA